MLTAGDGFMARADASTMLEVPESALRIRYYHDDHVGSSSVISDIAGRLLEESANYAFGQARKQFQPLGLKESYQFAKKERDVETGLSYCEMRFLKTELGRFNNPDPATFAISNETLEEPQRLNGYSYAINNPIVLHDPSGLSPLNQVKSWFSQMIAKLLPERSTAPTSGDGRPAHLTQMKEFGGKPTANWSGSTDCRTAADLMAGGKTVRSALAVESLGSKSGDSPVGNRASLTKSVALMKSELDAGRKVVIGVYRSDSGATKNEGSDN